MEVLYYISDCMIPFVILYLVGYGMCKKWIFLIRLLREPKMDF